jgi:hypothetical protein
MTTELQIAANRENSLLGGVKTEDGKTRTRFNALKHGILGRLITDYDKDFYQDILQDLTIELKPTNTLEHMLVERVAVNYLRLHRLSKAESEYMQSVLNPHLTREVNSWESLEKTEVVREGYTPVLSMENVASLHLIYSRYETAIENKLYRALFALVNLRKDGIGFVSQNEAGENGE